MERHQTLRDHLLILNQQPSWLLASKLSAASTGAPRSSTDRSAPFTPQVCSRPAGRSLSDPGRPSLTLIPGLDHERAPAKPEPDVAASPDGTRTRRSGEPRRNHCFTVCSRLLAA